VAGHRSAHQDAACALSGSAYPTCGALAHPFSAREPGPWLPAALHQRWAQSLLLCADGSLRSVERGGLAREDSASMAGGGWSDLRLGEKMLPATQAGSGLAGDASWHSGRSQGRLTGIRLLWSVEHRFYRAGQSDHPPWNSCIGSSNPGHFSTSSPVAGPAGMVARVLSLCPSSRIVAGEARAAARARGQTSSATLPTVDPSHGGRQNKQTMDGARGALVPIAAGFRLRGTKARDE